MVGWEPTRCAAGSAMTSIRSTGTMGRTTISENDNTIGNSDTLLYGAAINPLDLVISRQANDLRLAIQRLIRSDHCAELVCQHDDGAGRRRFHSGQRPNRARARRVGSG